MKYKIIADSSCDLTKEMKKRLPIVIVPFNLQIDKEIFVDDDSLDIKNYLNKMKFASTSPKSACPSPEDFLKHYEGDEHVFVVTISQELSGTYNSAMIAKKIYYDEYQVPSSKVIHVFNSKSASVGETQIVLKIEELVKSGLSVTDVIKGVEDYISKMRTLFLLESLENLAKAGRLKSYVKIIASLLAIKPIMGSNRDGTIRLVHKVRGYKKAFNKFIETIGEESKDFSNLTLGIAYCNCLERALDLKNKILETYNFKDVYVVEMKGLSSTYADLGGIVIAF